MALYRNRQNYNIVVDAILIEPHIMKDQTHPKNIFWEWMAKWEGYNAAVIHPALMVNASHAIKIFEGDDIQATNVKTWIFPINEPYYLAKRIKGSVMDLFNRFSVDVFELSMELVSAESKATDIQIGGDHYKNFKIQPVQFFHDNNVPFIEASICKYVLRWRNKNGIQDLEKARHYIDLLIELEGKP